MPTRLHTRLAITQNVGDRKIMARKETKMFKSVKYDQLLNIKMWTNVILPKVKKGDVYKFSINLTKRPRMSMAHKKL
jgi:hypothetical protein